MSATILAPTVQSDGSSTVSAPFAFGLDAVIQCRCSLSAPGLTQACRATLLLSADGGTTYAAANSAAFDLTARDSYLTFHFRDWSDKKFEQWLSWTDGTGHPVANLTSGRTFMPPWTNFRMRFDGNTGAAVTVSAVGDSGALSGGGGGGGNINPGTSNQLLFYMADGTVASPLPIGSGLAIVGGALTASGSGSVNPGLANQLLFYSSPGIVASPLGLGAGLSVVGGVLVSTSSGSGTVNPGTAKEFAVYAGSGPAVVGANTGLVITQSTTPTQVYADAATITFDLSTGNHHQVTLGGNRTLLAINSTADQWIKIVLKQDGTGSRTVTWFGGITWQGGTPPTLQTAPGSTDVIVLWCTSPGAYDGFPTLLTGAGSVTNTSGVTANGFVVTTANPTTTPAITVGTNITGVLKGNGTAIAAATPGTDYLVTIPNPSSSTLGGVQSIVPVSHQFLTGISTSGVPAQGQPAFTDISGSVAASQLPNPSASTLGGVQSAVAVTHQWINSIGTSGVPVLSQPAFTDISGSVAASQLPNPSASTLGGIQSAAGASHQWITSISTSGVPVLAQPAFADISGTAAAAQIPTTGLVLTQSTNPITTDTDGATITFNLGVSNKHQVTLGGNRTLAVSSPTADQWFTLVLIQDGTGSRTVTWFSGITWVGGSAPTLQTAAGARDVIVLWCISPGTYFGFVNASGLSPISTLNVMANTTGGTAAPAGVTLSALLDAAVGSTPNTILVRGASVWAPSLNLVQPSQLPAGFAARSINHYTSAGTAVTASGTATYLHPGSTSSGPVTVPSTGWVAGQVYEMLMGGTYSTASSGTNQITFTIFIAGTVLFSCPATTLTNSLTGMSWALSLCRLAVQSISAGVAQVSGVARVDLFTAAGTVQSIYLSGTASGSAAFIPITVANSVLSMKATWSATGNSIQLTYGYVSLLSP